MTVGLVIVSHSAQLARGVAELAGQMAQGKVHIAAAGGAGQDDETILGTNSDIIVAAIQSVDSTSGVLLLLDMGGAILSTEMALEYLDDEQRSRVQLTFAPLVEGAVAAAIEASLDHTLLEVKQAAENAASAAQLRQLKPISQGEGTPESIAESIAESTSETAPGPPSEASLPPDALKITLPLNNPTGLHARPASLVVQAASRFQSTVYLQGRGKQVNATSIIGVLSLGARKGDVITFIASGPDAQESLMALRELVEANFHETEPLQTPQAETVPDVKVATPGDIPKEPSPPIQTTSTHMSQGISTSAGVALGPAFLYAPQVLVLSAVEHRAIAPDAVALEQQRLRDAMLVTTQELETLIQQLQAQIGVAEAAIFEAQALMLQDPLLLDSALETIGSQHIDAASALAITAEQQAIQLEQLGDVLFAGRAADVRDVTSRVIRKLRNQTASHAALDAITKPVILIASDLTPSDTAQLRPDFILGIGTVQGGPTAHAAILARALSIPAIAGLNESLLQSIQPGQELGLDADKGILYTHLSPEMRNELSQRLVEQQQRQALLKSSANKEQEPLFIDGERIYLFANVGSKSEAEAAYQWNAEGIGLLRTEFLLANTPTMPNEEEQRQRYVEVFQAFKGVDAKTGKKKPIVVRTLDAGADKPMPALQAVLGTGKEANPALGLRGIRIHLAHQHLLETQFRALLLAAADADIELHIMVPMITTVEEVHMVRSIFDRVYQDMQQSNAKLPAHIPLGIMVEVPAAVVMAPELATMTDFFSIGANDLLQYTLASDRTNASVASLYNPMQPAVLRLVYQVAQAARKAGKLVAVCGEIASDARLAPLLVALGVQELSMAPNALPQVRAALTGRTRQELTHFADRVLQAATEQEVETLCKEYQSKQ